MNQRTVKQSRQLIICSRCAIDVAYSLKMAQQQLFDATIDTVLKKLCVFLTAYLFLANFGCYINHDELMMSFIGYLIKSKNKLIKWETILVSVYVFYKKTLFKELAVI